MIQGVVLCLGEAGGEPARGLWVLVVVVRLAPGGGLQDHVLAHAIQPFSQKSRTGTIAKEFQIGLNGPVEADWENFWNCCSAGFLGEWL